MILKNIDYDSSTSLFQITIDDLIYHLTYEQIEELNLSEDTELDDPLVIKITSFSDYNLAKSSALKYASRRTMSSYKLMSYLERKGIEKTAVDKIIDEFSKIGLLDDKAYVKNYIQDKKEYNRMSKKMIKYKLLQEGFDSKQVDEQLHEYTEEEELSNASYLLESKYKNIESNDYNAKNKAYQYLYRKGFSNDIINKVILEAED
ncbi:regulatory protein RecX [Microaceticoccus formicicus]|uniref:regulatory protein RecX n=1 Tax=Microaceticoccus formicicus TaxID=3118105 RepID=UPI003CD01D7E|nr:regulatory protein RecX [Peptoniphilaceae bacterium AMB_02]